MSSSRRGPAIMRRTPTRWRRLKKGFATELEKVRAGLPKGTEIEVWFQE